MIPHDDDFEIGMRAWIVAPTGIIVWDSIPGSFPARLTGSEVDLEASPCFVRAVYRGEAGLLGERDESRVTALEVEDEARQQRIGFARRRAPAIRRERRRHRRRVRPGPREEWFGVQSPAMTGLPLTARLAFVDPGLPLRPPAPSPGFMDRALGRLRGWEPTLAGLRALILAEGGAIIREVAFEESLAAPGWVTVDVDHDGLTSEDMDRIAVAVYDFIPIGTEVLLRFRDPDGNTSTRNTRFDERSIQPR